MMRRRSLAAWACAAGVIVASCTGGTKSPRPTGPSAPATAPGCGEYLRPVSDEAAAVAGNDPVFTPVFAPGGSRRVEWYQWRDGDWYVAQRPVDGDEQQLQILTASGAQSPVIDAGDAGKVLASFAVDPQSGDVYIAQQSPTGGALVRVTLEGTEVWRATLTEAPTGAVFVTGEGDSAKVGVVVGDPARAGRSLRFTTAGEPDGELAVHGSDVRVARSHDDELVSLEDGGIAIYDPTGTTRRFAIDSRLGEDASWNLAITGANLLADGSIVATSHPAKEIVVFDEEGSVIGEIGADPGAGGRLDTVNHVSPVEVLDGAVHYNAGRPFEAPTAITSVPVDTIAALARVNREIVHLGFGATLATSAPYRFFPSGTPIDLRVEFSDWWSSVADRRRVTYAVRSASDVLAGRPATAHPLTIPAAPGQYVDGVASVPLGDLPTTPGAWEVAVSIADGDDVIGADCLRYTVGADQLPLELATLPPAADDRRGIELAAAFGQTLFRSNHDLADCLGDVESPDASTTVSCPPELVADVTAAAERASALGVMYELQLGDDETVHRNAVASGEWGRLVGEMVAHLPALSVWECWNEPNGNTFESVADYVTRGLAPCSAAIKAADPDDRVIGGSFLDVSLDAWRSFIDAGGLELIDLAATHPYTGHNRSYEEEGLVRPAEYFGAEDPGALQQLVSMLRDAGYTDEILVTEQGFWNQGNGNYVSHGAKVVRRTILQESLGIDRTANFFNDGGYTVNNLEWALLSDELTPGGLSAAVFAWRLAPLDFEAWLPTGTPHTYAASYADATTGSRVIAAWADDLDVEVAVTIAGADRLDIVDQFGAASTLDQGSPLTLSGQVAYLTVPNGGSVAFAPTRPFGPDVVRRAGTTATASSAFGCDGGTVLGAELAIDAIGDADDRGDNCDGISAWVPAAGDATPTLTVELAGRVSIDRLYLAGKGLGSVETGVRSFRVETEGDDGRFREVARVDDAYFDRAHLVTFAPVTTTRVRITLLATNFSGYSPLDGSRPAFWDDTYVGLGGVYGIELYGSAI